jgi:hypothetical protein
MSVQIGPRDDDVIYFSIHLVSYALRPRPENQPAKIFATGGPIVWRGDMEAGYWAGQKLIKAPEDTVKVEMVHEYPYEGEIDIQLHFGMSKIFSIDEFKGVIEYISYSVLAYLNISAGELLIPIAPIQIRELEGSNSTFENLVNIFVKDRKTLSKEFLEQAVERFMSLRIHMPQEDATALDTAMRRYLDSTTEKNDVDRYCDLWEACEFVTLNTRAKGGKVGRIAEALSSHMRKTNSIYTKRNLENRLKIKELYETRGAIVHHAIQNQKQLQERSKLLSAIALELIRSNLEIPYEYNQIIEEAYQAHNE